MNQEGEFTVGENEKHIIKFKLDRFWGSFCVSIDGKPSPIWNVSIVSIPYTIEVGELEKHTLTMQIMIPTFFALFKNSVIQAIVDGKVYKTFK
jgi:hypothetical protein